MVHPNSLAALAEHRNTFKTGFDPNRNLKGRPAAGLSLREAYNELADAEKYPDDQLESIAKEHPNRAWRAAAQLWIRIRDHDDDFSKSGIPLVANDLDRIHDRTVGKPSQHVHVKQERVPSLQEAEAALAEALATLSPEQLAAAVDVLPLDVKAELVARAAPKRVENTTGPEDVLPQ